MIDTIFKPGSYKTRNGHNAVIMAVHPHASNQYPLIGYVEGSDQWFSWSREGATISMNTHSQYDLMPPTRTLWINIYSNPLTLSYNSEEAARSAANSPRFIKTITVEIPT